MALITEYVVSKEKIDLDDKLANLLCSEISEEIFDKCCEQEVFNKIENEIWNSLNDETSKFSQLDFYEGLADEYDARDEYDHWEVCVYNCDLVYMVAIAKVLNLEIPRTAGDTYIFGM